ncbi:MAG: carboxylesterase family protein, partial [bacterium]
MAYRIIILMAALTLFTGCGGGGGGSSSGGNGGGNSGNSLPAVLEVDSFDSETYFASISLYGSLNSQYWAPIDCDNPANFTPSVIATVRWRNVTTGETGETSIVIFCRDSGTIFGVGVHTDWSINSGLAIGVNQIVLDTYEGNTRIGTQTVSVTRKDANNILTDTVTTSEGTLKGLNEQFDLVVFRGVPYAAPPTGNRRFKAPEPPLAYSGTLDATHFSDVCLQQSGASVTGSEDCLYLNIWAHRDDEIKPVFVFLHGGGGGGVGGDMAATRGNALAHNADTIVVTLNRRMGILGSLAIQELVDESPRSTAGNYSVLDVIAALKWLKANVAEFNGDPNRIMLAGESAGGLLMCHILASPDAAG